MRRIEWNLDSGGGTSVAETKKKSVATPPGELTKSRDISTVSSWIGSIRVLLESRGQDKSNGV